MTTSTHGLQAIAVGQRAMRGKHPQEFMEELGFGPLDLVDSFSVSMAGVQSTLRHAHCSFVLRKQNPVHQQCIFLDGLAVTLCPVEGSAPCCCVGMQSAD